MTATPPFFSSRPQGYASSVAYGVHTLQAMAHGHPLGMQHAAALRTPGHAERQGECTLHYCATAKSMDVSNFA